MTPFGAGENLGPYRIIEQLGQGGMATVFKAYHASLDRYVAIKALHPAFLEDPNFLARFQREARVVARLEQANIVPIYDFAEFEGRPYLVMKYIEGETLKARLARGPMETGEIIEVARAVGAALAYAHRQGVLHRDIKPSNVLLTNDGQIYLADFGLARMAQANESTLTGDMMVGTPQYISPEQATSVKNLDARTDIYSLGIMLYEMVVGKVPFSGDTPFSVIHDHIYKPLPLPQSINPGISDATQRALLKALAKEPKDRYEKVGEFVDAFVQSLGGTAMSTVTAAIPPVEAATPAIGSVAIHLEATTAAPAAVQTPGLSNADTWKTPPPMPPPPPKKKRRVWLYVLAGFGAVFICLILLGILGSIFDGEGGEQLGIDLQTSIAAEITSEVGTALQTAEPMAMPAAEVERMAKKAVDLYRANQYQAMLEQLNLLNDLVKENEELFDRAMLQFIKHDAWLPAAAYLFSTPGSDLIKIANQRIDLVHQTVYMAAGDPNSKDLFEKVADRPLFAVGKLRYQLFFGDVAQTKKELGPLLERQVMVKEFPEIELLQVELYLKLNDYPNARTTLGKLLGKSGVPDWVRLMAEELDKQIPKE